MSFPPETFAARRKTLALAVGGGLVVVPGHDAAPMNYAGNVYPFRQDGTFRYLTGLDAPGLALALDADTGTDVLFGHDPTLDDVVWDGPQPALAERAAAAGIGHTAPPEALADAVRQARDAGQTVHTLPPSRPDVRLRLAAALGVAPAALEASAALVDAVVAQRLVKTEAEVAEMEAAAEIAVEMHLLAMRMAQPGRAEREVAGQMEALAAARGSHPSFPIILTRRGEVLHNGPTAAVLEGGDLLLVDAGAVAPRSGYAADLTRVVPVGGRFSDRQRAVVDVVVDAQEAALAHMRPGVSFADVHTVAAVEIARGLAALGIMRGDPAEAAAAGAHALFFPHGLGHAIGLDVHDMEALGEDRVGYGSEAARSAQFGTAYLRFARTLRPGYALTVEPGVYFIDALIDAWAAERRHEAFVDYAALERWRGTGGVRIEDDVVLTEAGIRVLGPALPKRPEAVEAAMAV